MRLWRIIVSWFSRPPPRVHCRIYLHPGSECSSCQNDPARVEAADHRCQVCHAPREVLEQIKRGDNFIRLPAGMDIDIIHGPPGAIGRTLVENRRPR